MDITQTDNEIILKFSKNIDIDGLLEIFEYLTFKEAVSGSKATQNDVDVLEKEIKSSWWISNRRVHLK